MGRLETEDLVPMFDVEHDPSPEEIMIRARQLLYIALDPRQTPPEKAYIQLQALKLALEHYGPTADNTPVGGEVKERIVFVKGDVNEVLLERKEQRYDR